LSLIYGEGILGSLQLGASVGSGASSFFSMSGTFQFEVNTTDTARTVKVLDVDENGILRGLKDGEISARTLRVSMSGSLSFGKLIEFNGLLEMTLSAQEISAEIRMFAELGSFGELNLVASGLITFNELDGFVFALKGEAEMYAGFGENLKIEATATVYINTSQHYEYLGIAPSYYRIALSGELVILKFRIALAAEIELSDGLLTLTIENAELNFFGLINVKISGYIRSDGKFDLNGKAGVRFGIGIGSIEASIEISIGHDHFDVELYGGLTFRNPLYAKFNIFSIVGWKRFWGVRVPQWGWKEVEIFPPKYITLEFRANVGFDTKGARLGVHLDLALFSIGFNLDWKWPSFGRSGEEDVLVSGLAQRQAFAPATVHSFIRVKQEELANEDASTGLTFNDDLNLNGAYWLAETDDIELNGTLTNLNGIVQFVPTSNGREINYGHDGPGLSLDASEVANIQDGLKALVLGSGVATFANLDTNQELLLIEEDGQFYVIRIGDLTDGQLDVLDPLIVNNSGTGGTTSILSDLVGSSDSYLVINGSGNTTLLNGSILMAGDISILDGVIVQGSTAQVPVVLDAGFAAVQENGRQKVAVNVLVDEQPEGLELQPTFTLRLDWLTNGELQHVVTVPMALTSSAEEIESALNDALAGHEGLNMTVTQPDAVDGIVPSEWIIEFGSGFKGFEIQIATATVNTEAAPYLSVSVHEWITQYFAGDVTLGKGAGSLIQGNEDALVDDLDLISRSGDIRVSGVVGGDHLINDLSASAFDSIYFEQSVSLGGNFILQPGAGMSHLQGDVNAGGEIRIEGALDTHGDRRLIAGDSGSVGNVIIGTKGQNESLHVGGELYVSAGQGGQVDVHAALTSESDLKGLTIENAGNVTFHGDLVVNGDLIIRSSGEVTFKGLVTVRSGGNLIIQGSESIVFDTTSSGVVLEGVNDQGTAGDVIFEADEWTVPSGAVVNGSGGIFLRPSTIDKDIYVGSAAALAGMEGWNLSLESLSIFVGSFHALTIGHSINGLAVHEAGDVEMIASTTSSFPATWDLTVYGRSLTISSSDASSWELGSSGVLNAFDALILDAGMEVAGDLDLSSLAGMIEQPNGHLDVDGNLSLSALNGIELVEIGVKGDVLAVNKGAGDILLMVPSGDLIIDQLVSNEGVILRTLDGNLKTDAESGQPHILSEHLTLAINGSAGTVAQPVVTDVALLNLEEVTDPSSSIHLKSQGNLLVNGSGNQGAVWLEVNGTLQWEGTFQLAGDLGVKAEGNVVVLSSAFIELQGNASGLIQSRSGSIEFAGGAQMTGQLGDIQIDAEQGIVLKGTLVSQADIALISGKGTIESPTIHDGVSLRAVGLLIHADQGAGNDRPIPMQVDTFAGIIRTGKLRVSEWDDLLIGEVVVEVNDWDIASLNTTLKGVVAETLEIHEPVQNVTQSLTLKQGWNEVAIGVDTGNISVETLFADHMDQIDQIVAGDRSYDPDLPSFMNTLDTLNIGEGIWIQAKVPIDQIEIIGKEIASAEIILNPGWNLIAPPIAESRALAALGSTLDHWENVVQITDGSLNYLRDVPFFLNTLSGFEAGQAYWVYAEGPARWQLGRDAGTFAAAPNGYLSLDVTGDLALGGVVQTHGDLELKANSVQSLLDSTAPALIGRDAWLETPLGFGSEQNPISTSLTSVAGHFGGSGLFMQDVDDLVISSRGLHALSGNGGSADIAVKTGDLVVAGTLGSHLEVTIDMSGGGLLELVASSANGEVIIDALMKAGLGGINVYSPSEIRWNPLIRSKMESLVRSSGPRN
jgi:hypothetical protein